MQKLIKSIFFISIYAYLFNLSSFEVCSCYDLIGGEPEIDNIQSYINEYEHKRDLSFLDDRLAPYSFDTKYHREITRLNSLRSFSLRYPHVYKNILICEQKIDVIGEFWYYNYEYQINRLKPGDYPVKQSEREAMLAKDRARLSKRIISCKDKLSECTIKILNEYAKLFEKCVKRHSSVVSYHDYGLFAYLNNDFDKAIELLKKTIELASKDGSLPDLEAKIYHDLGAVFLDSQAYDNAIKYLSEAISRDPKNKQAYFDRAVAYFETGSFDLAIQDYHSCCGEIVIFEPTLNVSTEFSTALFDGLKAGVSEATVEFVPSMCNTFYGIGEGVWVTAVDPIGSSKGFASACKAVSESTLEYFNNFDWNTLDECSDQLQSFCNRFSQLSESEKGQAIGYIIGLYGVDIFAGGAICKGIKAYRNLRNANRLCNLEAMAASQSNKEILIAAALKHSKERDVYFKTVKYNWGDHNKHVPGHNNYDIKRNRSIWNHKDPEGLLKQFAGTGQPLNEAPGYIGYRERIDFKEHIGYFKTLDGVNEIPTTIGIIHYGKKGAHIVPARP